ncbi:hypothetical protein HPP92_017603 [Vanilla planifolia]|uniref:Protein kinase domain-containing protein n=1 Tax=Vanilla planifolia TaxID=51239 RepID=A0A835UR66_VANPL|nr:hypothetical protein HPP92_017603 [Vanilla planifolia]
MTCFHCSHCCNSPKVSRMDAGARGGAAGCFRCRKASKEERGEMAKGVWGIGCVCICESTAKEGSTEANGCCFRSKASAEEKESSSSRKGRRGIFNCLHCCHGRSDKEKDSKKGKGAACCYLCNEKPSKKNEFAEKPSNKRGNRVMCCCESCCSEPLQERRRTSKRSCEGTTRCFVCACLRKRSASTNNRKRAFRFCWQSRKTEEKVNQLAILVHNISFKSDTGGKDRLAAEEILRLGDGNIAGRVFTYKELLAATNNFRVSNLLGSGGFGRVYKGHIAETNEVIAVKKLDRNGYQGTREFLIEVLMLGLLHHPNLVKLLGYCAESNQRILVYEYMPFGSLQDHLLATSSKNKPLDWFTRMKIAAGAAKGLEHLHDVANPPVIYRDMKASNILLDKNFHPKLSDFGLAKLGPVGDKTHVSTRVMGTYGYCAPEYALTGQLTKMSDVYSYGVLLLELITGRKAIDITRPRDEQHLVHWAAPLFKDKSKFVEMADPLLDGNFPRKALYQALAVADMCLQHEASTRPLISDVVSAVEYLANPKPDFPCELGAPIDQQSPVSHHESVMNADTSLVKHDHKGKRSAKVGFIARDYERKRSAYLSLDGRNHESDQNDNRVGTTNSMDFDEENNKMMRNCNFSFDEETFQSLSSVSESSSEEI